MNRIPGIQNPVSEIIRVLLIEDNPGDARLIREMLIEKGATKFNLEHVGRISEGLKRLSQDNIQVILLDLFLPDSHGLETVDRVCHAVPHLPVVVLTGIDDEALAIKAVRNGVQDYLVKGQMDGNLIMRAIRYATERKRAEKEKGVLEEQLRQSQKMEAIGSLAGGIAHDFNNLLTIIKGYSQLSLLELKEDNSVKKNIEEIKRATDRASDLVRQLLAFSRSQILDMKILDLNTTLRNVDKMLRRITGENIELVTLLAEDLGRVKSDSGWIEQVIMNLAVNARDAMPSGGKLIIETANVELDEAYARRHAAVIPGRYVMVAVSDTGVGMTPEIRERIFEPFFTTKEKGKGTGLGLSTVYGIVKQSNGNLWVYSEPGHGTSFKIYLPRVDEPLEEEKEKVAVGKLARGNETILVVEDDEQVRNVAVRILSGQGYKMLEASQGDDAFLICAEHSGPIHLLVTDVVMPKMSGCELVKRISSIRPEIKVLYMSGYTDSVITYNGILEEGVKFIQKPFTIDALAAKVCEVLGKRGMNDGEESIGR